MQASSEPATMQETLVAQRQKSIFSDINKDLYLRAGPWRGPANPPPPAASPHGN